MSTPSGPNPAKVALSILKARRMRRPHPRGSGEVDHSALAAVLVALADGGVAILPEHRDALDQYRRQLEVVDPDSLNRDGALAFWINLYNAGALDVAAEAAASGESTVLRVAGGFRAPWAAVAGEELSLDAIEHGKIRRFGDPRIHGGLVCGSASCPTLRYEPFTADDLDRQLDDQMRSFLAGDGAAQDVTANQLRLSRVFLWYGADFTRPHRMPTVLPSRKTTIADALGRWLSPALEEWRIAAGPSIAFQPYDWSLACSIR